LCGGKANLSQLVREYLTGMNGCARHFQILSMVINDLDVLRPVRARSKLL